MTRSSTDARAALDANLRVGEVSAAVYAREFAHNLAAREVSRGDDVEQSVVGPRVGREVHPAARVRAAHHGGDVRAQDAPLPAVETDAYLALAPTCERAQGG